LPITCAKLQSFSETAKKTLKIFFLSKEKGGKYGKSRGKVVFIKAKQARRIIVPVSSIIFPDTGISLPTV